MPPNVLGNASLCKFGEQTKNHIHLETASVLPETYALKLLSGRYDNKFTGKFTEAFLLILKHQKWSKCASTGKWLTIFWSIHNMGYRI